jgi:hypothetical protein
MINPEELAFLVNTLAISIAKGKTVQQLNTLAVILTQIADTLVTISFQKENIEDCLQLKKDNDTDSNLTKKSL